MHYGPVKTRRRLGAWVLARILAGGLVLTAGGTHAETWPQVFARAWANFPAGRTLEARGDEVAASHGVAAALFPAAPAIGLFQRSDRWNEGRGKLESEVELSLPLWLPGQKVARQTVAEAESEENRHALAAARLALAGELRGTLWNLRLAGSEAELVAERLATATRLEADVVRRVQVGEMARTDLLLAKQETVTARVGLADAQARLAAARQRYRVVAGGDSLPEPLEESLAPEGGDLLLHPRLAANRALVAEARARLQLARESRRDAPSLALQARRERDQSGAPAADSLRLGITFPLATEARNAPLIASANTALIQNETEAVRLLREVEAGIVEAEAQGEAARIAAELAVDREAAAAERLTLLRRSFELGETALVELLRAQSQASEAKLELARSRIRLFAARASLNQARGFLP